jgi:hypothetical protein
MFWYVYSKARSLQGDPRLGDGNCVALVQKLTSVGHTSTWSPGLRVMDTVFLPVGCVIATFEWGRYPNKKTGNHACFFLEYGPIVQSTGKPMYIWVMDQWQGPKRKTIAKRPLYPLGKSHSQGNANIDSDNADMFYVVNHMPPLPL